MRRLNQIVEKGFLAAALWSLTLVLLIFVFMLILGLPLLREGRFWGLLTTPWAPLKGMFGIYPMMIGTLAISLLSLTLAFPLSLGVATFTSVLKTGRFGRLVRKTTILMTAIPTVVYAFVGLFLLVPLIQNVVSSTSGLSILTASLVLALLISPTMILIFQHGFENLPPSYQQASEALGARPVQKLFYVMIPYSWKGIVAGLILGMGRALGDTLVALMLAGNTAAVPGSIFESARTLTAHIALVTAADFNSNEFRTIFACGILLYLTTTILVIAVRSLTTVKAEVPR